MPNRKKGKKNGGKKSVLTPKGSIDVHRTGKNLFLESLKKWHRDINNYKKIYQNDILEGRFPLMDKEVNHMLRGSIREINQFSADYLPYMDKGFGPLGDDGFFQIVDRVIKKQIDEDGVVNLIHSQSREYLTRIAPRVDVTDFAHSIMFDYLKESHPAIKLGEVNFSKEELVDAIKLCIDSQDHEMALSYVAGLRDNEELSSNSYRSDEVILCALEKYIKPDSQEDLRRSGRVLMILLQSWKASQEQAESLLRAVLLKEHSKTEVLNLLNIGFIETSNLIDFIKINNDLDDGIILKVIDICISFDRNAFSDNDKSKGDFPSRVEEYLSYTGAVFKVSYPTAISIVKCGNLEYLYHVIKGSNEEQKQKVIEAIKKFQISPDILESKTDIYNSDLSRGRKGEVLRQFLEVDKIYKGKYKGGDSLSNAFSQSAIKYFMSNENWGFKISSAVRFGNVRQLYSELSLLPRLSGALEEDKYREICLAIPNLVQYINPYSETPRINLLINTLFKITKNLSGPSERYSVDEEGIRKVIVENLFAIKPLPFLAIASAFEMSQIDPFGLDISVMDIVLDEELAQGQLQSQASLLLYLLGHPNLRKDSVTEELQGKIIELCKKIPQEKSDEIYNTAFSDILVSAQEEKMFNLMKEVGFLKDRVRSITSRSATLSLLQEENAKERKEKEKVRKGVMANAIRRMEGDVASQAEDLHDSGPAHEEEIESASTSPERSVYQESYNQDSEAGEWAEVKAKESRPRRNRAYYRPLQRNKERNDLSPPIESVKKNNVRLPRVLPLTTKTWDKLPKIEDQVAMKEIMREQEVRSREHEVDVFLSGNRNISSTQDLPDFLQEIVDKILATGSQVILKGSAIYLDPNSSRKPADLDIEILIKGLSDHGEGLQEGDLQRVGDILRGLFGEDVQSLKIYRSRDDKHFTANFQAVNGKLDVSVYDSEKEPNPNLSWTTNRERRVIFDSNGDAHYDTPRGFEGYVRSVYEEFSGSREVDEEAVSQIKQSQCLFINKDARKLILRLVFLQTIGMFDEYELGEALGDFYSEGFQFDSPVNLLCSELRVDQDLAMGYADEGSRSYAIQDNVAQRIDEFMGHHCLKDTPESKYYFLYNLNTILNTQFKSVGVDESFQVYHELIKQTVYSMAHESYQDLSKPSNEVHEQAAGPLSSNSIASAKV